MLSQIKIYIIGAIAGLFSLLGLYAKYQSNQKDKYKKESETQKDIASTIEKRVEAHEKREEVQESNADESVDTIDDKLHDYYRD